MDLRALALAVATLTAATLEAAPRSRAVRAEFQRLHPCPATQAKRGPCRGYQVDHIQPLCAGGRDEVANLQWLTVHEHRLKTKKDVAGCFERVYKPAPAAAE